MSFTTKSLQPTVKVGVVQAAPKLFDLRASISQVEDWLKEAKAQGCEMVLFPEAFLPCYPRGLSYDAVVGKRSERSQEMWLDYWQQSLSLQSEEFAWLQAIIRKEGMYTALGVTERDDIGGSLYCTLLYFDQEGELVGKHRKLKPTGLERYLWAEGDGKDLQVQKTPFGKLGGLICWENYMPLPRTHLYNQGIEIYIAPTADTRPSWQATLQHIALEGRCFVLGANQFVRKEDYPDRYLPFLEEEPEIMSTGGSAIYGPNGEELASPLWNESGLITATLDFTLLAKAKLSFDAVGHYARATIFELKVNE